MSTNSPDVKSEEPCDLVSDEEQEDDISVQEQELEAELEHEDEMEQPEDQVPPVPMIPPQPLSASVEAQPKRAEIPAFFQNSGLVMRNAGGLVPSNEATLPTEKSFTIQVGPKQFRLSGASIQSDAPSYFTRFFEAELERQKESSADTNAPLRTLYVDRDPDTFKDIALHLQGYHVQPRDPTHYVRLFADAQFYILPRLIKHLYESDVLMRIGEEDFIIPRDLFEDSPGNSPNYFTLGFNLLFSTPGNPFPGLDVSGLLRPPAIKASCASGRSGRVFADILDLLRGYEVHIRNEEHRAALLRDCRYYHLRGLEQKIIPHTISWNTQRSVSEIIMRVEDLRQSGLSLTDESDAKGFEIVQYARPFADEAPHELIMETGKDSATITPGNHFIVEFHGETRTRIMSLFKVVATKFAQKASLQTLDGNPPGMFSLNEDGIATARIEPDALVTVDGEEGWLAQAGIEDANFAGNNEEEPSRKRRRVSNGTGLPPVEHSAEWTVMRAQWRVRLETWSKGGEIQDLNYAIHMYAVNLDVVRGQKGRSRRRGFLRS